MPVSDRNPRLVDVEAAFFAIGSTGERRTIGGVPPIWTTGHVQGLARHGRDWIASVSAPTLDHGFLCVMDAETNRFCASHDTPRDGLDHPGGMQVCGDYLVVAMQKYPSSDRHGKVLIYDLTRPDRGLRAPVNQIALDDFPAGAAACTDIDARDAPSGIRHVVAAHDNGRLWFWRSDGRPLGEATFAPSAPTPKIIDGAEQVSLVTGAGGGLFAISTEGHGEGLTWADKATLWRIDLEGSGPPRVTRIRKTRHFKTRHGAVIGPAGVHMRYGGGARAASPTTLELFAAQMHFIGGSGFSLNVFAQR